MDWSDTGDRSKVCSVGVSPGTGWGNTDLPLHCCNSIQHILD